MDKIESREDYLEAILQLNNEGKNPISIDVVKKLGFSKPSVSIAMKKLREDNLVIIDDNGVIYLTPKGKEIAEKTLEKHEYLKALFMDAGLDEEKAEETACGIEHHIDEETFLKLKNYLKK